MRRYLKLFLGGTLLGIVLALLLIGCIFTTEIIITSGLFGGDPPRDYKQTATTVQLTNDGVRTAIASTSTAKAQTRVPTESK
jgi:hypothetical protein